MIIDKLNNAKEYFGLGDGLKKGLEYLTKTDFSQLNNGKYEIENDEIYAVIQDYQTKPEGTAEFEAHRKYTDIQYIVKGEERLGWANIEDFSPGGEYNEKKDIIFGSAKGSFVKAKEGYFVIFTSNDAHKPSIAIEKPEYVKKVVVKILEN